MELVQILIILLVFFSILLFSLSIIYIILVMKNRKSNEMKRENTDIVNSDVSNKKEKSKSYDLKNSVYDFMDFDEIKDNMIIRKNRTQYVMVVRCKGGNYDLMSEEEKVSVESGFVQFLNTLRSPIQLYVQTTSLNLKDILEEYQKRLHVMEKEIRDIDQQIYVAKSNGEMKRLEKLAFEKRRRENVLEYSIDISDYIARMSMNRNILQQKTYVVVSYYSSETEISESMTKEEVDNICFSELYTRTQTVLRSLGSSGVTGKILNSEELSELLYAAYNRDESEIMQLSKALDAEYDALYSVGKDVLEKKKEMLDEMIDREAVNLATESIKVADEKIKNENKIMKKALEIIEEYKGQMSEELYDQTKKEIVGVTEEDNKEDTEEKKVKRGRPRKTE